MEEIGSAGATCIATQDGALAKSDIVLGVGAIHTQSFYDAAYMIMQKYELLKELLLITRAKIAKGLHSFSSFYIGFFL